MVTNNCCDYQPTQYNVQTGGVSGTLNNVTPSATSGVPVISQGSSSQPVFGTAVVAGGGTGDTSFTAYSVVCGGTTSTGALQNVSGVGSTGQVLTSNGASALPTWQANPVNSFQVKNQVFTSSGTYTPTSGMVYCSIQCLGGGGAGAGASTTGSTTWSGGSGGGSGEYAVGIFSSATIGASQTVTIGAAGTGNSGAAGGAGGNSSVGILISSNGGGGGFIIAATTTNNSSAGGVGGTGGSGGDYRTPGSLGGGILFGISLGTTFYPAGASSQLGSGGIGTVDGIGGAGAGYGAGGGGALNIGSQSAVAGGAGTKGIVIITEYIT